MINALPTDWSARVALDLNHLWHPFTQMEEAYVDPPWPLIGAEGCELILEDGTRVLDGVSSWWTNIHGHGHPRLVQAIAQQAARLDHVMFAGFTHEPALELVTRLRPRLPDGLNRCFFSDDGSTAVEVALKMAFQAQFQRGETQRTRFGALAGGYHGDTLGAVGVGELDNFGTQLFHPLLLQCDRLEVPEDPRHGFVEPPNTWSATLEEARTEIRVFFQEHGPHMAAFICEPMLQGAHGMKIWPPELLQEIRHATRDWGVYLILDEVFTGFGRTGSFLALEQADVEPDLLCLSKALTGGILPLSLTWATEEIFKCFLGSPASGRAFLHGHSFTANPIACAVACASLELFESEHRLEQVQDLSRSLKQEWMRLAQHPSIRRARVLGGMAACQLVDPVTEKPHSPEVRLGWRLHRMALNKGLLVRPIGDCLYLLPPYVTPAEKIHDAVNVLLACLEELG